MANISIAEGTINLHGPAISVHAFLHFSDQIRNWYYNVQIMDDLTVLTDVKKQMDEDPMKELSIELPFTAVGRWHFSNNAKHLLNWLNHDRKNQKSDTWQPDWSVDDEQCWQQMNNEPLTITFKYIDLEEGNDLFIKELASLKWKKGEILDPLFYETTEESYDITAQNLQNLLNYEDVFDYSSYSVKDLDENEEVDWAEYIKEHVSEDLDVSIFKNKQSDDYKTFIKNLGAELDKYREDEGMNAIWYSEEEWFDDEVVQDAIKTVLK